MAAKHPNDQQRPYLPPATIDQRSYIESCDSGIIHPTSRRVAPLASIHFPLHPAMPEIQELALQRGWLDKGFTTLTIPWIVVHWTTDGWQRVHILQSTDVPCPIVDGACFLPGVSPDTEVEFAVRVGVACRATQDASGTRETAEIWFNNGGKNYRQNAK